MAQHKKAEAVEILDVSSESFQEIRELLKAVRQRSRIFTREKEGELISMDNIALRSADGNDVRVFLVCGGRVIPK